MDNELTRALRRVDPPAGFAERVLQRSVVEAAQKRVPPAVHGVFRWAIAATVIAAIGGGGLWFRAEGQRRVQGEEARRQVLVSLNIAGSKLRLAAMRVNHEEER